MIGRTVAMVGSALVLAGLLLVPAANAARCPKLCKDVISSCKAGCAELATRKEKRTCKRDCKRRIVSFCKENDKTCPASPSGAFLDEPLSF